MRSWISSIAPAPNEAFSEQGVLVVFILILWFAMHAPRKWLGMLPSLDSTLPMTFDER